MAPKSAVFLLAILSVLAVAVPTIAATAAAPRSPKVGGYQPIANPNTPEVAAIAKFAVAEHNKESKGNLLMFVRVVKAQSQVVAGVNYRLVIFTENGGPAPAPATYTAVVYKNLKGALSLVSFKKYEA